MKRTPTYSLRAAKGINLALVLLLSVLNTGCRKDSHPSNEPTPCKELPPTNFPTGYEYIRDSIDFIQPQFNPNDGNEVICMKRNSKLGVEMMIKYNLITKKRQTLYEGKVFSTAKWHENDWILFGLSNGNIYKIKSNGQDLTQLTNTNSLYHPIWSPDGEKFIAFERSKNFLSYLYSSSGIFLDSILFDVTQSCNWNKKSIAKNQGALLEIFNTETKKIETSFAYKEPSGGLTSGSIIWLNDSILIWSTASGIKTGNRSFTDISGLRYSCFSRMFLTGDINNTKQKMIWHRATLTAISQSQAQVKNEIVLMDIDGTNLEVINPE